MNLACIAVAFAVLLSVSGGAAASICSDVLEKAPADAKPAFKGLPSSAAVGDVLSACLLLKAGKSVNGRDK
jgi:hypothetical protein